MLLREMSDTCVYFGGSMYALNATTEKEDMQLVNPEVFQDVKRFQPERRRKACLAVRSRMRQT